MKIVNILGVARAFIASAALAHQSVRETQKLLAMQNSVRQDTNDDGLLYAAEFGR